MTEAPTPTPTETPSPSDLPTPSESPTPTPEASSEPDAASGEQQAALTFAQQRVDQEQAKDHVWYFGPETLRNALTSGNDGVSFDEDAAQYALDHVQVDWNWFALQHARAQAYTPARVERALHDQSLGITPSQIQYALDNMQVDWNPLAFKAALDEAWWQCNQRWVAEEALRDRLANQGTTCGRTSWMTSISPRCIAGVRVIAGCECYNS